MKFSNETRINPEVYEDSIPVIHGQNYYIDEQGYVSTFNLSPEDVYNQDGDKVQVNSLSPVTEFIYIVNNKLAYKTSIGLVVTDIIADKQKYVGGFQGIAGFDEVTTTYQYINNKEPAKSQVTFEGRINTSKQLEIKIGDEYVVPLGEFRCYISNEFFNINYSSVLPNSFGDTFTVTLASWTTVQLNENTNYIKDMFIQGNTLYLSTRLYILGSVPYDWSQVDKDNSAVVWSEDSRLNGGIFAGNPSASKFYIVNMNTSTVYYVDSTDLTILQEYQHKLTILGVGVIDKYMLGIVDKEAVTVLSAYVSLNTWLIKAKIYFKFNQLSAYEEMITQYITEQVEFTQDLNSIVIKSTQRAPMMLYLVGDKIISGCHTSLNVIPGKFTSYLIDKGQLYKYTKVEESGEYEDIDITAGNVNFDSFIYIGSDLEPDVNGSTMRDTEIVFEGKLAIVDGDDVSVESSSDVPTSADLPVRTNQSNPDNEWFLYTKTLRYPISYTDWIRISMMPTTKILNISLVVDPTQQQKTTKKKGSN